MSNPAGRDAKKIAVHESSGNVFEDLGIPDSAGAHARAEIAVRIASTIEKRGLTLAGAAHLLGVTRADVSHLLRGRLEPFSTEQLHRFLTQLA